MLVNWFGSVGEVEIFVCRQSKELFFFQPLCRSKATSICVVLGHGILEFLDSGIGAAEATHASMCASVESKEGKNVNIQAVTHGFVVFVVDLKEADVRICLCKLAYLGMECLATSTPWREEVDNDELLTTVEQ